MKKATGIVRRTDALARMVVPVELRRHLGIPPGGHIEFYVDGDYICIKKYEPGDDINRTLDGVRKYIEMNDTMLSANAMAKLFGKIEEMKAIVAEDGSDS